MTKGSVLDQYDQFAVISVPPETGALSDGGTIIQLQTGLTNRQSLGWAVSSIDMEIPHAWLAAMTDSDDNIRVVLTQNGRIDQAEELDGQSVIERWCVSLQATIIPIATGTEFFHLQPLRVVYPAPRLIIPQNIYGMIQYYVTGALTAADSVKIRIHYKEVELGSADWYDLLQMRLPLGAV